MTIDVATAYREGEDRRRALADQLLAVKRDQDGPLAVLTTPLSAHQPADWIAEQPADVQPEPTADPELADEPDGDYADEPDGVAEAYTTPRPRMKVNPAQGRLDGEPTAPKAPSLSDKIGEMLRTGKPMDLRDQRTL